MPLDFPNSPTNGQVFNGDGVSWRWDGGASTVDIVSASNVTIRGHGTIDGNGAAGTYPNPIASLYKMIRVT
jgi:uncharacterized protein YijF (DUF1287 family)